MHCIYIALCTAHALHMHCIVASGPAEEARAARAARATVAAARATAAVARAMAAAG